MASIHARFTPFDERTVRTGASALPASRSSRALTALRLCAGRLRDECLNKHWFRSIADARRTLATYQQLYNTGRRHGAHGNLTPAEFAATFDTIGRTPLHTILPDDWTSDGGGLTTTGVIAGVRPVWSPDGARIAYARVEGNQNVTGFVNADGTNPVRFRLPDAVRSFEFGASWRR